MEQRRIGCKNVGQGFGLTLILGIPFKILIVIIPNLIALSFLLPKFTGFGEQVLIAVIIFYIVIQILFSLMGDFVLGLLYAYFLTRRAAASNRDGFYGGIFSNVFVRMVTTLLALLSFVIAIPFMFDVLGVENLVNRMVGFFFFGFITEVIALIGSCGTILVLGPIIGGLGGSVGVRIFRRFMN